MIDSVAFRGSHLSKEVWKCDMQESQCNGCLKNVFKESEAESSMPC